MTDAERSELDMLEGGALRRELTEFEEERLCALREKQRRGRRFPIDLGGPEWLTAVERAYLADNPLLSRHDTMLPPPAEDDGELE